MGMPELKQQMAEQMTLEQKAKCCDNLFQLLNSALEWFDEYAHDMNMSKEEVAKQVFQTDANTLDAISEEDYEGVNKWFDEPEEDLEK